MGLLMNAVAAAQPVSLPDCQPAPEQVLAQLNVLRASARNCGAAALAAAPALRWHDQLASSAVTYAQELLRRDTLSHEGEVAVSLLERFKAVGYTLRRGGENLAAGQETLAEVLEQWLLSSAHCENLMQAEFRDVGLACMKGPGLYHTYWVLHLGLSTPSNPPQINRP